ncbi:hypothetical protein BECAL_02694 [Bellilinea caldifistulae]|uniref:Zinc ribbon domain-containing protein n=1 Tax=Bellilinea caldifistulae TaxID=360411 RepID=A0A0P6XJL4_9CHLR|nr:hypothetical protein [Bellilinea caldifistulae]KPL75937.1 hypothetical protein AC812_08215 [Bellilinea caldifistulae]GAP11505.1 hypothetical protein BECAL_02694 [Bellilinea caldifistulae]
MSEIICPHCGASNPTDAIECKKCHRFLFETPSSSAFPFSGDDDDWLKNLREDTEPLPESESDEAKSTETPPFSEEVPDWLARIRQRSQEELGSEEGQPDEAAQEEELPDWLKDVEISAGHSGPASVESSDEEELPLPDWLSLVSSEEESETPPSPPAPAGEEELDISQEQLPDWLKGIEQPEETAEESPIAPQETADWLTGLSLFKEDEEVTEQPPFPAPAEEEPDWLQSFETFETTPAAFTEEQPSPAEADEDWLKAFESFEGTSEPTSIESEPPGTLPDEAWLQTAEELPAESAFQEAGVQELENLAETIPEEFSAAEDQLTSLPPFEEGLAALSDELHGVSAGEQPVEPEDFRSFLEEIPSLGEGASSAFILETPSDQPAVEQEFEVSPFISEELPEWFDEQVLESSVEPTGAAPEGEESLEPAELPGWLEAMRPIEAVAPGRVGTDEDQRIETSGPLSGFQGVLPAEALITQYSKPSIYSARLQVNEKQRNYANLLESILQQEKQGHPSSGVKSAGPQILARMLIGILLAVTILFVLVGGVSLASPPALFAPENVAFFSQIRSLTSSAESNAPILLAVDFEPALAGEISTVASPVMDDLIQSGKSMVVVSINPTGAVLAEELLLNNASDGQVLNLGYLPGGVSSIAALASQPALAASRDRFGTYAWDRQPFQTVQHITDFAAILLVTDNTDTSRLWIEQLTPLLDKTPLLVIASNQAAPMIQPYVQNGQSAGMLAGLPGLAAYQQLNGRTVGLSAGYLDAYQAGLMVIVVLVLLFSLYYLVMQLFKKPEIKGK